MGKKTLLEKVLDRRGINKDDLVKEKREKFEWNDMEDVADKVVEEVIFERESVKVGVLYDVDVDGLFAGYIMENYLERKKVDVTRYMNKNKKHGLNKDIVKKILSDNLDWLFVVDAGSGDGKYINFLTKKGLKVVVLDHHPYEQKVELDNTKSWILNVYDRPDLPKLSGCGVVYRFVEVLSSMFEDLVGQYEKFVGITVISDMCDMSDKENRYYVKRAFEEYRGNRFLMQFPFYGSGKSFYQFGVIPYLNACIRVGEEEHAMDFINNMNKIAKMNVVNRDRRRVIDKQNWMIEEIYLKSKEFELKDVTLLLRKDNEDELRSVGGLVANKMLGKHKKPAIVMNRDGDVWKGSLRSNTFKKDVLVDYGFKAMGHDYACGLEIHNEDLKKFMKNFEYEGEIEKDKVAFSVSLGKLKEKTWVDLAMFNEFSGVNMNSIKVRIKDGVSGSMHIDEVSKKKNDIVFKGIAITDFTGKDTDDLVVEPILRKGSFQLVRV